MSRLRALSAFATAAVLLVPAAIGTFAGAQDRGHEGSITEGIECSACHTPEGWRVGGSVRGDSGFDHARTGFPLTGRHQTVACTSCHVPGQRARRECASCHQDDHQGRLGRSCDTCHSAVSWRRTNAIELHRMTRLPLTGMHVLAACTDCHRRNSEREYSAAPAECYACHEAEYNRVDVHPNHNGSTGSPAFSRDCSACHRAIAWSPAVVDPSALPGSGALTSGALTSGALTSGALGASDSHDLRFPISYGSHRGAPCSSCHVARDVPTAVACTGCHAHSPLRLRSQHRTVVVPLDGSSCLGCHPGGRGR